VARIYVPGERSYLTARERERTGIPMSAERIEKLLALAGELSVAPW
jgi:LDH2 family malate/lactate/ureidoglycolate dehydrogenase